jgi:hypothetical protein
MTDKKNPGAGRPRKPRVKIPRDSTAGALDFDNEVGLGAAIRRLRASEIQSSKDYQLALLTKDAALISQQKKNWLDLIEQLRKVEQSTPDIQRMNAETLSVDEVEREVSRMCAAFRVALESIPRSLPQRLQGLNSPEMEVCLRQSINDALAQLHTNKWACPQTVL